MANPITWGILGTGDIARQMAEDLRLVHDAKLHAVASRTQNRADVFGETHRIPIRYDSYEALAADPAIDVVYIATPHSRHCADTLLCLEHGKHVLCEKPLAVNQGEVEQMLAAAREHNRFLMEALWTAFFPAMQDVVQVIKSGRIGIPRLVSADFSYKATAGPESRLFNPALAGGALLDIGVYTVALADLVFEREPEAIHASWTPATTGVDESAGILLDFGPNQRALLSTSLAHDAPQEARICGDAGNITIPHRFSQPDGYSVQVGSQHEDHAYPRDGYGYHLEARAVTRAIQDGRTELETVSWERSRRIVRTLDKIRAIWGLSYPMESGQP